MVEQRNHRGSDEPGSHARAASEDTVIVYVDGVEYENDRERD